MAASNNAFNHIKFITVKLPFIPDDPRIVDSTGALELPKIPKRMLSPCLGVGACDPCVTGT